MVHPYHLRGKETAGAEMPLPFPARYYRQIDFACSACLVLWAFLMLEV